MVDDVDIAIDVVSKAGAKGGYVVCFISMLQLVLFTWISWPIEVTFVQFHSKTVRFYYHSAHMMWCATYDSRFS